MKNSLKIFKLDYVFVFIILFFVGIFLFRVYIFRETYQSVGRVYNFSRQHGTGIHVQYEYWVDYKLHQGSNKVNVLIPTEFIGKYYRIKISKKNPNWSTIDMNKEISNKIEIQKAGFTN